MGTGHGTLDVLRLVATFGTEDRVNAGHTMWLRKSSNVRLGIGDTVGGRVK